MANEADTIPKLLTDMRGEIREALGEIRGELGAVRTKLREYDARFDEIDRRLEQLARHNDAALEHIIGLSKILTVHTGTLASHASDISELKQRPSAS